MGELDAPIMTEYLVIVKGRGRRKRRIKTVYPNINVSITQNTFQKMCKKFVAKL